MAMDTGRWNPHLRKINLVKPVTFWGLLNYQVTQLQIPPPLYELTCAYGIGAVMITYCANLNQTIKL